MRRRWRFQWDGETVGMICGVWVMFLGWIPGLILRQGVKHHAPRWYLLTLGPWFGPFIVVGLLAGLWFLPRGLRALWRSPPLRREWESAEDLREARRAGR